MRHKIRVYYSHLKRGARFFRHSVLTVRNKRDVLILISRICERIAPANLEPSRTTSPAFRGQELIKSHRFSYIADSTITVSFIYPFFRKDDVILASLKSLEDLIVDASIKTEVIIIDDGSEKTDISKVLPDKVIYLWRNKFEYGISRSRNLGAKIANGEYFVFLDPDLILSPNYLQAMMDQFHRFGDRVILTGYLKDYHYKGCEDPRSAWGVWENPDTYSSRFLSIAGGNMAIHRRLFSEVGGFDEDLIYGGVEDILFGYLASQLPDTGVVYSSGMTATHIPHPEGLAHARTSLSWDIVAQKYPDLYIDYIKNGLR
ncbi:MAG: glycosyltransferase family 2 protein [Gammaproteobacteria bacterium]|jgi:glycosyltransferase involved in cell wall biosynthesis|nr:glycosyltransferase family 2 protein [Gammaproteobacteria bacterium]